MLLFLHSVLTDIEVACYGYEGIDAVKDALRAGLSCSTESMPIKVTRFSEPFCILILGFMIYLDCCDSLLFPGLLSKSENIESGIEL